MIVIEFVMKARWHFFTSKCIFFIFFNKCILIYTEFHYNSVLLYTWNYLLKFCMSKLVNCMTTAAPVWQRHHLVLHIVTSVVLIVVLNLDEHLYLQIFSMRKFQLFFFLYFTLYQLL